MATTRKPSTTKRASSKRSAGKRKSAGKRRKTLALIAHDGKKAEMLAFAKDHLAVLRRYDLVATSTTGRLVQENSALKVRAMLSGPLGGDAQIAAMVAQGEIAAVFFFIDPLGKHPHDPDIQTLLRICNVHEVPLATNPATASFIISEQAL
jgi:methylglyoxal synthase